MTCNSTCDTTKLFESTREARLEALARAQREEEARRAQIERLQSINTAIQVREATEMARYKALQEAEKAFKIRERDILERQLEETIAMQKRMQDQYEVFVTTTNNIAEMLNDPAKLFLTSTISCVEEMKDYFKLTYDDGREVRLPFGAVDLILKSKLHAISAEFSEYNEMILQLQSDLATQAEQIESLANLFKELVSNISTYQSDLNECFDEFKADVKKDISNANCDIQVVVESLQSLTQLVNHLNSTVTKIVAG